MKDKTDEFSFILKPSSHGVGVFATHNIKQGTYLRLFSKQDEGVNPDRELPKEDVPASFRGYCVDRGDTVICPRDFGEMPIGWYLNHSRTPNARHSNLKEDYLWYASRDILAGEEILVDYNSLEEPPGAKEGYYRT